MIILISNYKCGMEKGRLTLLLANYLAMVRRRTVTILDMDGQQSLTRQAAAYKTRDNQPPYSVASVVLKNFPSLLRLLLDHKDEIILLNMPEEMDDDELIPAIIAAELVLCPFAYDQGRLNAAILFAMVVRKINTQAPLAFIPMRIGRSTKHEKKFEMEQVTSRLGIITPTLSDHDEFEQVGIFHTPLILYPVILPVLELLYERYILGREAE